MRPEVSLVCAIGSSPGSRTRSVPVPGVGPAWATACHPRAIAVGIRWRPLARGLRRSIGSAMLYLVRLRAEGMRSSYPSEVLRYLVVAVLGLLGTVLLGPAPPPTTRGQTHNRALSAAEPKGPDRDCERQLAAGCVRVAVWDDCVASSARDRHSRNTRRHRRASR